MKAPVPSRRAVAVLAWAAVVVGLVAFVWLSSRVVTLSDQVAASDRQRDERTTAFLALVEDVASVKVALDEVNRRCSDAAGCTPVRTPDVDDGEVQDGEIQEPELQEPEIQERERQEPEVDDPSVPGAPGAPGADSTVPGPQGPAGAPGADGKDGVDGKDGRGITDVQCGDDGRWTVTYTDGTTSDAGACRVAPGNSGDTR